MSEMGPLRLMALRAAFGVATAALGILAVVVAPLSRRASVRVSHVWGRVCMLLVGVPASASHVGPS